MAEDVCDALHEEAVPARAAVDEEGPSGTGDCALIDATTSCTWNAIESVTARAMSARVVLKVIPENSARASDCQ